MAWTIRIFGRGLNSLDHPGDCVVAMGYRIALVGLEIEWIKWFLLIVGFGGAMKLHVLRRANPYNLDLNSMARLDK